MNIASRIILLMVCWMAPVFAIAQDLSFRDTLDKHYSECIKDTQTSLQCVEGIYEQQMQLVTVNYNRLLESCNKEQAGNLDDDQRGFLRKLDRTNELVLEDEFLQNALLAHNRAALISTRKSSYYSSDKYLVNYSGYYLEDHFIKDFTQYVDDEFYEIWTRILETDSSKVEIKIKASNSTIDKYIEFSDTLSLKNNTAVVHTTNN